MPTTTIPAVLARLVLTAAEDALAVAGDCEYATLHAIGYATDANTADGDRVADLVTAAAKALAEAAEALTEAAAVLGL